MSFDFDKTTSRRGTHSAKWDGLEDRGVSADDGIPMWVADMDFTPPASVTNALSTQVASGFLGYYTGDESWRAAICAWMKTRHAWDIEPDWLVPTYGVISGISLAIQAFSEPDDSVVIFSPVYPGFISAIKATNRKIHFAELRLGQARHEMDLEALDRDLPKDARIVILCSPHNPGGRIWSVEEQRALGEFCERRGLLLISDEIHHDLVYGGNSHVPFVKAMPELSHRTITFASPTKTFNIAGLHLAEAIIADEKLRAKFIAAAGNSGLLHHNTLGMIGAEAAYAGGADWLDALLVYLEANRDLFNARLARELPGLRTLPLESTYLSWVDFSDTGLSPDEVETRLKTEARIAVSTGNTFGPGGESWMRFNIALPRPLLDQAIDRLVDVFGR